MSGILTVRSPYDRHIIREFKLAGEKEVEQAVSKAHSLFRDPSRWLARYKRIEILEKLAGLPEDYCTALVCSRDLTEKLAADPRIGYLTFIGSHEVGWRLRSIFAPGKQSPVRFPGSGFYT